jgi:hypothetical protein
MDSSFDFFRWSDAELARAETTAGQFLAENQMTISQVFARQCAILQRLVAMLGQCEMSLELDCLARIGELADGMQKAANGFFDLGSQPLVARMLLREQ